MEYGINRYERCINYIYFILLIAFSSFEYFFREEVTFFAISLGAFIYCLKDRKSTRLNSSH